MTTKLTMYTITRENKDWNPHELNRDFRNLDKALLEHIITYYESKEPNFTYKVVPIVDIDIHDTHTAYTQLEW